MKKAKNFLILAIEKSGHNPKPVIKHSLRVANILEKFGYSEEVVIAATLHDLLEDSDTKVEEIEEKFGGEIADLVLANSFDENITDKVERYKENFDRLVKAGRKALVIKAADILDNSNYYHLADKKTFKYLLEKMDYFIKISKPALGKEPLYKNLLKELKRLRTSPQKLTKQREFDSL